MDQIKIGKFIASQRKMKNLTQKQFAEKLGVSDRSVSKWENGKCMPDLSLFERVCDELDITYNELLSGEKFDEFNHEHYEENLVNVVNYSNQKMKDLIKKIIFVVIILGICVFVLSNYWVNNDEQFGGYLFYVIALFTLWIPFMSFKTKRWNHLISIVSFIICCFFLLNEVHYFHYLLETYQLNAEIDLMYLDFGTVRLVMLATIVINLISYITIKE